MYTIRKVCKEEAKIIQQLGAEVYRSTYSMILSEAQINFMLAKNYTPEAIQQSMSDGQDFYFIFRKETEPLGFIAIQKKGNNILRIEKLYLLAHCQGFGFGKVMIDFAMEKAKERHCATLELNVNRENTAYHFYLKQGFQVVKDVNISYYDYVLNDYVMQKSIG